MLDCCGAHPSEITCGHTDLSVPAMQTFQAKLGFTDLTGCITYTFIKKNNAIREKLYYDLSLILQSFKIQAYFLIT